MLTLIRRFCSALWYRMTCADYRRVAACGLFDEGYYLRHNPDLHDCGLDLLAHYLSRGFAERRRPGPLFDRHFYLQQCPQLDEDHDNPLLHFLAVGRHQGLRPNPLVDPHWYGRVWGQGQPLPDALGHFLAHRHDPRPPLSPSPYFDAAHYCASCPEAQDLTERPEAALRHYLEFGLPEHRSPSVLFDCDYYLDKTPALRTGGFDAPTHYALFGYSEGKSPCPLFDPFWYRQQTRLSADSDPFADYLALQGEAGLRPCPWFDPQFYQKAYLGDDPQSALQHFLQHGRIKGLYPNGDIAALTTKPVFSVVLPVYDTPPAHLGSCIRSVLYQSYPHWQLCIADDCSPAPGIRPLLDSWASADPRISVVYLPHNSGISAATNAAAALASGDYLLFLDHDDELAPEALQRFAEAINRDPAYLYYSDEDLIGADGRRYNIFRKPEFNPPLLLCHNYVTHCVVARRTLFDLVGGCEPRYDGAQDLDLFLKLSEKADRVVHLAEVLYHWRASEKSTSINHEEKHYADAAGREAVTAALARRGIVGEVLPGQWKFFYRLKRAIAPAATVCLALDWRQRPLAELSLPTLLAAAGHPVTRILVLATEEGRQQSIHERGSSQPEAAVVFSPRGQSTAATFAAAAALCSEEFLLWVDGRQQPQDQDWLTALLEYGQEHDVAMVRGLAAHPRDEHPEITPLPDCTETSPLYYARFLADCSILMNGAQCPQEVMATSGGIFLLGKAWLDRAAVPVNQSLNEQFFFLDLALRLRQQGARNVYTPGCRSNFHGAALPSSPAALAGASEEMARFRTLWGATLAAGIPFYNSHVSGDAGRSEEEFRRWLAGEAAGAAPP
mgnify:CR=1 FL=1